MIEVKGEYGRASSTVGGLRIGRPPPLTLCQLPFIAFPLMQSGLVGVEQRRSVRPW